jgi:HAD superfamily hydrolase (TIGR01484 family)
LYSVACLFDVDGVLTLPITEHRKISIVDPKIVEMLLSLNQNNIKFSLITGRAYPWVNKFLLLEYKERLKNIPIFLEYGLVSSINNNLIISEKGRKFREDLFEPIIGSINDQANQLDIYFESTSFVDYPNHGSLWLEEKNCMISIASNKFITAEEVQNLVENAIHNYKNSVRFVKHHLGCDILPKGWSKEQAAIESYNLLDPEKKIENWFVFGDNESDREMCQPFSNSTFIDTKIGASNTTTRSLKNIFSFL